MSTHSNAKYAFLWVLFLCCLSTPAFAQSSAPSPSDEVVPTNIELVQTDIAVVDKSGKCVDSLKSEPGAQRLVGPSQKFL